MARRHAVQSRDQSPDGPRQETDAGVHGRRHNSNPSSQASPQPPHPAAPPRTTSPRATETNDPPTPSLVAVNANEYADARARSAFGDPRRRWAPGPDPGPLDAPFGYHHGHSTTRLLRQLDEGTLFGTTDDSEDSDTGSVDAQDIVIWCREIREQLRRQPIDEDRALRALAATGHEHVRFVDDQIYTYRTGLEMTNAILDGDPRPPYRTDSDEENDLPDLIQDDAPDDTPDPTAVR